MRNVVIDTNCLLQIIARKSPYRPIWDAFLAGRYQLCVSNDIPLAAKYHDHELTSNFRGFRECHIRPDWLLLYTKEDNGELHILNLFRTGTHSDIF